MSEPASLAGHPESDLQKDTGMKEESNCMLQIHSRLTSSQLDSDHGKEDHPYVWFPSFSLSMLANGGEDVFLLSLELMVFQ